MTSLFARTMGLSPDAPIATDAAVAIVHRRSKLTYTQARLVVLDYQGHPRDKVAAELKVSIETLKSYWRRVYKQLNYQYCNDRRGAVRLWVEALLHAEVEGRVLK